MTVLISPGMPPAKSMIRYRMPYRVASGDRIRTDERSPELSLRASSPTSVTAGCWPGRCRCIASCEIDKPELVQAVLCRPLADPPNDRLPWLASRVRCGTVYLIQIKPSGRAAILPLALGRERSPSGDGLKRLRKFSIAATKGVLSAEWTAQKGRLIHIKRSAV